MSDVKNNKQSKNTARENEIAAGQEAHIGDKTYGDHAHVSSVNKTINNHFGGVVIFGSVTLFSLVVGLGYTLNLFPFLGKSEGKREQTIVYPDSISRVNDRETEDKQEVIREEKPTPKPILFALSLKSGDSQLKGIAENYLGEHLSQQNLKFKLTSTVESTHSFDCSLSMSKDVLNGLVNSYLVSFRMNCALNDLNSQEPLKQYNFRSEEYTLFDEADIATTYADWLNENLQKMGSFHRYLK